MTYIIGEKQKTLLKISLIINNMKILEGIKQTGRPFNIPDASRDDLPAFLVEMDSKSEQKLAHLKEDMPNSLARQD